ncbi:MAG: LysR family transcriptional regulator [Pannonibacter sp.]
MAQGGDRSRSLYAPAMRYFAAVAELGSIRAAARELNVASSAVNRQILWLEEALDLALFERVGRGLRLAPAGEVLLAHVRRTYSDFEGTVAELDALKGLRRGTVSVATVESLAETILPDIIGSFRKTYPGIHVAVTVTSAQQAAHLVETAEADVGFTFDPPRNAALSIAFAHELPIGAVMAPDHEASTSDPLTLADCLRYPIALPARGLSLRTRLDAALARIPGTLRTYVEANSLSFMRALARRGMVISFQTRIGLEKDLAAGTLVFRPLTDAPLQQDRFAIVTSSMRALALAPGMFFDHALITLKDHLPAIDAI